jgi:hypothetical protein
MNTYVYLWQYLTGFFLKWEMFQTNVVEKIETHILRSIIVSRTSCRLLDNVEKYGRARQATDDNIIRHMRFAWWISKATDTHSEYVLLIAFPRQQWLRERASMLRFTYIVSLVLSEKKTDQTWKDMQMFCIVNESDSCRLRLSP